MQGWQQTLLQHKAHIAVPHSPGQQPHSGKAPQRQQAGRAMLLPQHSTAQELLNRQGPDIPTSRVAPTGTACTHAFPISDAIMSMRSKHIRVLVVSG